MNSSGWSITGSFPPPSAATGQPAFVGNRNVAGTHSLALFCSVKCPGKVILQAYDLAVKLRDRGVTVIGGFHSPMEKEFLSILLRGSQPVIVCPARSIEKMRIPPEWTKPLNDGRLLIVSPFKAGERRPTVQMALERNRFVASLASQVLIAYAEPSGKTEQFCGEVLASGKPVFTLENEYNRNLIEMGAVAVGMEYEFGGR
ncbi:MAG: DNA-binding protein [Chloroflexi bacterium]|nr:DNA-binding protein [Chloroflexota bacterium]